MGPQQYHHCHKKQIFPQSCFFLGVVLATGQKAIDLLVPFERHFWSVKVLINTESELIASDNTCIF